MVHWVGEKSNVIICLARDSTPVLRVQDMRFTRKINPSTVYISYDYGDTFENKNEHFKITDGPEPEYAQIDKFYNHPKFNTYVSIFFRLFEKKKKNFLSTSLSSVPTL